MNKSGLEWKVGLFVAVGLVLLAALLIEFSKGMMLFSPSYTILMRAPNVGGLKTRAQVLMAGVQVGTVSDIKLAPSGTNVTIYLSIYSQYVIHKDARFLIEQSGFLGDQYVAIMPTDNLGPIFQASETNDTAYAEPPFDMQEVARSAGGFIKRIDETAKRLNDSIADIRRSLLNEQTLTNLSTAAANLRVVSERTLETVNDLETVVTVNGPAVAQSSSNLVFFTQQMNKFADGLDALLATNSPGLKSAVDHLESSSETLQGLLGDVQAGKGPVGKLLKDEQMAADLSQIAYNLSVTTSNLNRLGLWGILWQHKPPRTNAPVHAWPAPKNPFD
jgi:phospholipid/cholesterol/gamma-HCH transport system substrate-binding protein